MKLSLDKTGELVVQPFPYRVHVEADQLNDLGYIIENGRIQAYFDNHNPETNCHSGKAISGWSSCERIAIKAAQDIAQMVYQGGVNPRTVSVSIGGSGETTLTAYWEHDAHNYVENEPDLEALER